MEWVPKARLGRCVCVVSPIRPPPGAKGADDNARRPRLLVRFANVGGRLDGESPFSCELGLQLVGREGGRASELTQRQWVVVHVVVVLHASGRARLGRLGGLHGRFAERVDC